MAQHSCAQVSQPTISSCADGDLDLTSLLDSSSEGEKHNLLSIYCPRCPSIILRSGKGTYIDAGSWPLPNMQTRLKSSGESNSSQLEDVSFYQHFWAVTDIFTFENIGYTNTVDGRYKYLTCADCECGPLGVQVISDEGLDSTKAFTRNCSYLALGRVVHR